MRRQRRSFVLISRDEGDLGRTREEARLTSLLQHPLDIFIQLACRGIINQHTKRSFASVQKMAAEFVGERRGLLLGYISAEIRLDLALL